MTEVYLSLGSNVGDSSAHFAKAIELLGQHLHNIKQSAVYTSKAVHYTDQPDFLNMVISGETDLSPEALLDTILKIELEVGREERFRWGPREIDVDIVFYGDQVIETERLTVPHFRFRNRGFVLQPLNDLNPTFKDPVTGQTVNELLEHFLMIARSIAARVGEAPTVDQQG